MTGNSLRLPTTACPQECLMVAWEGRLHLKDRWQLGERSLWMKGEEVSDRESKAVRIIQERHEKRTFVEGERGFDKAASLIRGTDSDTQSHAIQTRRRKRKRETVVPDCEHVGICTTSHRECNDVLFRKRTMSNMCVQVQGRMSVTQLQHCNRQHSRHQRPFVLVCMACMNRCRK